MRFLARLFSFSVPLELEINEIRLVKDRTILAEQQDKGDRAGEAQPSEPIVLPADHLTDPDPALLGQIGQEQDQDAAGENGGLQSETSVSEESAPEQETADEASEEGSGEEG